MQQFGWLRGREKSWCFEGRFDPTKIETWASVFLYLGLLLPEPAEAKNINTLSANANCDEVTIRQAAKLKTKGDEVDWFALDRMQREYAGQELLPEHEVKEPEADTVTGCAIKEAGQANGTKSDDNQIEMVGLTKDGFAARAGEVGPSDEETSKSNNEALSSVKDRSEQSVLQKLLQSNSSLVVKFFFTFVFAAFLIVVAFGLNYVQKVIVGLMNRRRVCVIPASVVSGSHEITGHITIMGLGSCRFVPDGKSECDYMQRLFDEPQTYFFDLIVGEIRHAVFLDTLRGHFVPCIFDKSLSVKQQMDLLAYSTKEPQIGQLVGVRTDAARHKAHVKARASYERRQAHENGEATLA